MNWQQYHPHHRVEKKPCYSFCPLPAWAPPKRKIMWTVCYSVWIVLLHHATSVLRRSSLPLSRSRSKTIAFSGFCYSVWIMLLRYTTSVLRCSSTALIMVSVKKHCFFGIFVATARDDSVQWVCSRGHMLPTSKSVLSFCPFSSKGTKIAISMPNNVKWAKEKKLFDQTSVLPN